MAEPRTNATAIATSGDAEPLRVLQITDTHLFADPNGTQYGVNTRRSLAAVIDALRAAGRRPDAVLVTGDLSEDKSIESYRVLQELLDALAAPVFVLPGNHDDPVAMRDVFADHDGGYCGILQNEHWRILMLSSWQEGKVGGRVEAAELERFRAALDSADGRFALVCVHHQPVAIGSAWLDRIGLDNGAEFMAVARGDERVRGVVWGHVHQEFDEYIGRVRLLACPSTCRQFAPLAEQFANDGLAPGWRWLTLRADGNLETSVGRLDGDWSGGNPL